MKSVLPTRVPLILRTLACVVLAATCANRAGAQDEPGGASATRQAVADTGEAPIYAGMTNRAPLLDRLFERGVDDFGVNLISQTSNMQSGETGGFGPLARCSM